MLTLMLHRVLPGPASDNYYYRRGTAISREKFLSLLAAIEDRGLPLVTRPPGDTEKAVCLTFDDGYADVAWALDKLLERDASAWLFPVMKFAQTGFSVMDDLAAWIDARPAFRVLEGQPRVRSVARRLDAARYKRLRQRLLGVSADRCDPELFLSEEKLSGYSSRGIRLGVHGVTHKIWTSLGSRLFDLEIYPAVRWLNNLSDTAPEAFCLPHGKAPETKQTRRLNRLGLCFGVDHEYEEPGIIKRRWIQESTDIGLLLEAYLAA